MQTDTAKVPVHLGFIVDGNRRWAKKHGLPVYEGHLAGHAATKDILPHIIKRGVKYISFYLFSTENWKRSAEEVAHLMGLILRLMIEDLHLLIDERARVRILGTRQGLADNVIKAIDDAEAKTKHFTRATVAICLNYGGQLEIADAVRSALKAGVKAAEIAPETIRQHLYAPDIPDVDMIVRSSGEQRLSNFMLWRAAYSEFMFIDKFWPDMRPDDVDTILKEYARRQRRFGGS